MSGIAIIGMACRLPGADTPATFWQNLCAGVDSVSRLSDEELRAAGVDPTLLTHPGYVKAAAMVRDADRFDAGFFGFSPREATLLDPQQRLLLEVAWEAVEDGGYHPESYDGVAGVFAGGGGVVTSYLVAHLGHPAFDAATASVPHLGNDKDFLATRVSYKLNFTGPSITVQTACSTSLVAVHLACQSLRAGECDMALAAATTVRIPQAAGYLAEKGNVYSLDGRCRAFDAAGQGTIFGSGVAAVLLKSVDAAIADGDQIYAVITGSAVNNDGGRKVSYPSPSVTGQARAMVEAFTLADCSPDTVRYVECHATGTVVGDPPELHALTRAFREWTARSGFCAVGSVKTNIGHPEQTAGLAGLIKTALALRHGLIPPTLHFTTPNPKIDFAASPFFVNTELAAWPDDPHPRRAAVNSLGIGGTNAFVALEEAPREAGSPHAGAGRADGPYVITLSAKTRTALLAYVERVAGFAAEHGAVPLADLAYTSNVSRSQLPWRFATAVGGADDLRAALVAVSEPSATCLANARETQPKIAMLFSGQGSQYPGMAMELYHRHPVFREALDRCGHALREHLDVPLLELLSAATASRLDETRYTQPALVAVQLALAETWRAWGVTPSVVLGHSVGEIAAACVAGVFTVEDALRLAATRGRLMQALPTDGAMVAVLASESEVQETLRTAPGSLVVAAVNGPRATVLSGTRDAVHHAVAHLAARDIAARPLRVSHAFHSPLMDPILDDLQRLADEVPARPPSITLVSNASGKVVEGAPDGAYWRAHARECVRFADGVRATHARGVETFMEIGPGTTLVALAKATLDDAGVAATWLPTLPRADGEWAAAAAALARLYVVGGAIDWPAVHRDQGRRRVSMPTYPFERQRYWPDPVPAAAPPPSVAGGVAAEPPRARAHPLLGPAVRDNGSIRFESVWTIDDLPYLADHRVGGALVLPTSVAVEAALAAAREHFGRPAGAIEGLVHHEMLRFADGGARRARVVLVPRDGDRAGFSVASLGGDGSWHTHVTGEVTVGPGEDDAAIPGVTAPRCRVAVSPDAFYTALRSRGLEYGPAFRGIVALHRGRGAAASRVRLPAGVAAEPYALHPAFVDACLHVFPALVDGSRRAGRRSGLCYLPIGIERLTVHRRGAIDGTVSAVRRNGDGHADGAVVDLRVVDDASRVVLTIDGLRLRAFPLAEIEARGAAEAAPPLYGVTWHARARPERVPASSDPGAWLVFADDDAIGTDLTAELERRGARCHVVRRGARFTRSGSRWTIHPRRARDFHRVLAEVRGAEPLPLRGIAFLWAARTSATPSSGAAVDRDTEAVAAALFLTQALLAARATRAEVGRLWLVTENVQRPTADDIPDAAAAAMLWGFGRTVALEAPAIWGGLVDLPPTHATREGTAASLALELLEPDGETEIAPRHGTRHVARLEPLVLDRPPSSSPRVRADATYLITGGLGMLGLRTARMLVEDHGARSLVLTGRSAPSPTARRALARLRARGARVRVIAADVAREADVRRVLRGVRGLPPLRGVFHGAGVLDDGVLTRLTWSQVARVAAAKVRGSVLLHHETRRFPLDFFVVQSSLLSLTGSPGQASYTAANAFMDALIEHRRAIGLPGTALNWGPWGDGGMARSTGARGETMWQARGVRFLAPDRAVRALDLALRHGIRHAAVADVDWPRFLAQAGRRAAFYEMVSVRAREDEPPPASGPGAVRERLRTTSGAERRALVADVVRHHVMTELGFKEPIDARRPLDELGLDSLMSVNVANRLEEALGMPVPVVTLIRGPSIERLVDALVSDLDGGTPRPSDDVPPTEPVGGATRSGLTLGDGWLVVPRPRPAARIRLVCFPFAGAGAAPFRPWTEALHESIELIAVEPPGRAARIHETPEGNLSRFLGRLGDALRPLLDRPVAFFGHCLGGLLAWETARRLRQRGGLDLRAFFVAGVRPPHRLTREGAFEHGLLERLLAHSTFDPLRPVHEQPDEVFAEVARHFGIAATDEFLSHTELRTLLLPAVRADFALTAAYRHEPEPAWDVPITCFAGLDDPYVAREDAGAWSDCTRTSFRLHWREGAHFLVVDDRDFIVRTINEQLTA